MSQDLSQGTSRCLNCGAQFPGGGRFCPVCGQPLAAPTAPTPPAVPQAPTPGYGQLQHYGQPPGYPQPQGYSPAPGYLPGYGYAPVSARRSRKSVFVGLGVIGLIAVVVGAVIVINVAGGHGRVYAGTFSWTGSMGVARSSHTATLLSDGRVLIAGGSGGSESIASAELYEPKTGTFSPTGSMTIPRVFHTATLLSDGRVLIAGGDTGSDGSPTTLSSADLYDPRTSTFAATGSLAVARSGHSATLLSDGRVLVAGGWDGSKQVASAELYDPTNGTFSSTGSMAQARGSHSATLLSDGRVLIAGGWDGFKPLASVELYDPRTAGFAATGSMATTRTSHTATLLSDGRILIVGGRASAGSNWPTTSSAELYDPKTGAFTVTASMATPHGWQTATLLSDGRVLIAGGWDGSRDTAAAEAYDSRTGSFTSTGSMTTARDGHTATLLSDGRVLVAGGFAGTDASSAKIATAELYS